MAPIRVTTRSRRPGLRATALAAALVLPGLPALAQGAADGLPSFVPAPSRSGVETLPQLGPGAAYAHLFREYYQTGMARLMGGDPAGSRALFQTAVEVAPDVPQLRYALAVSTMVADFDARRSALAEIEVALAADPAHPLYRMARVMADPALSVAKPDGALYLTQAGAAEVADLLPRFAGTDDASNGKYLALWLGGLEDTGDAALPKRLPGFAAALGKGDNLHLAQVPIALAVGRLFVQRLGDRALQPYEAAFAERILAGTGYAKQLPPQPERRSDLELPIVDRMTSAATG
jgi:hypothetical protein